MAERISAMISALCPSIVLKKHDALSAIISAATAAIEHGCFYVYIDGGAPIYRERVYCYELIITCVACGLPAIRTL